MKTSWRSLLVLGLGCLAAGGATGCSARSLLELDMDVQIMEDALQGETPTGPARLQIDVHQGNRMVKEGTSAQPLWSDLQELRSMPAPKVKAGVYLDHDVSGDVVVNITIIDKNGCPISGRTEIQVKVTPGQATPVTVRIEITHPQCPGTTPDAGGPPPAGGDAGASETEPEPPPADAAMSETTTADAGDNLTDVYCPPETGPEVAAPPSCTDFCTDAVKKCPQSYPNHNDCVAVCMTWPVGELSSPNGKMDMGDNTLGCRASWLNTGATGTQAQFICSAASVQSLFCIH